LIGKTLGNRYRVLREIGSGGMAWVYLAEDTKDSQLIAVKILYPQFGQDLAYIQRFNREAKLASTLTDPHIVKVLDYGADRDVYYLVMEYIEGEDLRTTLSKKGPFAWAEALEIIDQLATALEHAYQHGVVHRDIKPQNLMLTDEGLLKVLDFGIARIPMLPSLTQSGFIGSPYYVSPEQAMGEEVDIRSDIYSSGIVLYELLSGNIPFDAKSPWSIISQHVANEPPPIELPQGDIPKNVHDLIKRMVAKKPQERFQTPAMLRQAVATVLAGQSIRDHFIDTQPVPLDPAALADSLYKRALEAIKAQEWARAADLLTQTLQLNPTHPEAHQKLAQAESEAFLLSLYNAAKRAIKNNHWEEAINNLNGIVEIEPNYKETARLLVESRRAMELENSRQYLITRYNEGIAHFEAGRWKNAIEAFQEVKRLAPGYQQVDRYLTQAERQANPGLRQRIESSFLTGAGWRWLLVMMGVMVIFLLIFFGLGNRSASVAEDSDTREQLKILYEQAQQAIGSGNKTQAVALLDEILKENPDYADVANLRRELLATPTPTVTSTPTATPTPMPTPTVVPTPTSAEAALAAMLTEAETALELAEWAKALTILNKVRAQNPDYQKGQVSALLCDTLAGRGLETIASIETGESKKAIQSALADFETGAKECPRRTDLSDQAERATVYLKAVDIPPTNFESIVQLLTPVVAVEPDYAGGEARQMLFNAYLGRGDSRREGGDIVGALSDYEAALAVPVDDAGPARTRRVELLLSFNRPEVAAVPTPEATPTRSSQGAAKTTPIPTPKRPVTSIKYPAPQLVSPAEDAHFAGRFSEVFLEWQPVGPLAQDEYYDVTLQYIFGDEFVYWGTATKENRIQLTQDIGVGQAGGDRFRWFVTVRKANTAALSKNNIDLPLSPQSEIRTFVWSP
jgi:serine/threonine protein kinase